MPSYASRVGRWPGDVFGLRVPLSQEQTAGNSTTIVRGEGNAAVNCTTTATPWTAQVAPASGAFKSGTATASAHTNDTAIWIKPASVSKPVKLRK